MRGRTMSKMMASVVTLGVLTGGMTGCEPTVEAEFRAAANGAIQQGILSVLEGIVNGAFAVLDPDKKDNSGAGGSGGESGSAG
jgi:hypothetical protein